MNKEEIEYITIPLNEYKELLIIKGKYEELKSNINKPLITYTGEQIIQPYKLT